MKIRVTQEHIDEGESTRPSYCPIALALVDEGFKYIGVFPHVISIYSNVEHDQYIVPDPSRVRQFILDFDKRMAVEPFEFEIDFENKKIRDIT